MKRIAVYALMSSLSIAISHAQSVGTGEKLPGVQNTRLQTGEDQPTLYAVALQDDEKNKDEDNDQGNGKGKAKGKGKGKAKGKNKDKGNREKDENADNPQEAAKAAPQSSSSEAPNGSTPAAANAKPVLAQPGTAQARPAPALTRSAVEVKKELDTRVRRINTLQANPASAKAALATISAETGIPVARLESQLAQHRVGYGGLLLANEMGKSTGKKPIDLMSQREKGRDWDRLATENKFDLSAALPKLERVQQAMEAQAQQKQPKR